MQSALPLCCAEVNYSALTKKYREESAVTLSESGSFVEIMKDKVPVRLPEINISLR